MNIINENICTLCGGTTLKNIIVDKGYLWLEERLFCILSYPGLHCSDCKEDYIRQHTYGLFYQILTEGSFEAVQQQEIPLYPYDNEVHPESRAFHRIGLNGTLFCIGNVPVQREGSTVFLSAATQRNLQKLSKQIEEGVVESTKHVDFITVCAQKN